MQTHQIIDHIVAWLEQYRRETDMQGFIVGVSGGVDSAVTSTLCAKTGGDVTVLNMPIHQNPDQYSRASHHIKWLEKQYTNVQGVSIDLTPVFESFKKTLPVDIQDGLTLANSRSRLRMITLYAFATHHRRLVVGTGNKVEDFGVGFFTKYGDGGVDISPIADLLKSQVYTLARALKIDPAIIDAPPTDGLWADDRTDEHQIGATYDELEWAMEAASAPDDGRPLSKRQKQVMDVYRKLHSANKHKMEPIPVCIIPDAYK